MMNNFLARLTYGSGYLLAKGDHDDAMNAINAQRQSQTNQQTQLRGQFQNQYDSANTKDQDLRDSITKGYQDYLDPTKFAAMMNGIGGVSGGIDPSHISSMGATPYEGYKNLATGVSPAFRSAFDSSMGQLDKGIADYSHFADTGGFSDADVASMRAQATAPTRQIYSNADAELTRDQELAGGNIGNSAVARLRMAGKAADAIGNVNTNTESNIAQMKQQGKEFGITGETQATLAKSQAQTAVEQLDSQMKQAGLAGMTDIEKSRLSAELENAHLNQNASSSNASIALAKAQLPLAALKGETDLYGTTPGATALAQRGQLDELQLAQTGNLGLIGQQINASNIPSDFSQAMGNIGSVVGLAGTVAGGIAGGMSGGMGGLANGLKFGGGGAGSNLDSGGGNTIAGDGITDFDPGIYADPGGPVTGIDGPIEGLPVSYGYGAGQPMRMNTNIYGPSSYSSRGVNPYAPTRNVYGGR